MKIITIGRFCHLSWHLQWCQNYHKKLCNWCNAF